MLIFGAAEEQAVFDVEPSLGAASPIQPFDYDRVLPPYQPISWITAYAWLYIPSHHELARRPFRPPTPNRLRGLSQSDRVWVRVDPLQACTS